MHTNNWMSGREKWTNLLLIWKKEQWTDFSILHYLTKHNSESKLYHGWWTCDHKATTAKTVGYWKKNRKDNIGFGVFKEYNCTGSTSWWLCGGSGGGICSGYRSTEIQICLLLSDQ